MKLLYLSILCFLLVSTFAISLVSPETIYITRKQPEVKPLPFFSGDEDNFPILSAQGVIAVDMTSNSVLYEKNPDTLFFPASTTKILTALVSMDFYDLNEILTVGINPPVGQKMGLYKGEAITINDLLYGLLVFSGNDAAEALASGYEGGREEFIVKMNEKASEIGLSHSNFINPTGLDEPAQVTTARDLIRLSVFAMENPYFAKIVSTREVTVHSADGRGIHKLVNLNELLGKVDGVLGVKTGWTENARENLVTYVDRGGRRIMIAMLGSQDRFGETKELIDWVFNNYEWRGVYYSSL